MNRSVLLLLITVGFALDGLGNEPPHVSRISWEEADSSPQGAYAGPNVSIHSVYPLTIEWYEGRFKEFRPFEHYSPQPGESVEYSEYSRLKTYQINDNQKLLILQGVNFNTSTLTWLKLRDANGTTIVQLPEIYTKGGRNYWSHPMVHRTSPNFGVFVGLPTSDEINPLQVAVQGKLPMTVEWYRDRSENAGFYLWKEWYNDQWTQWNSDFDIGYSELLFSETLTVNSTSSLKGMVFDEETPLFVKLTNAHGTFYQGLGSPVSILDTSTPLLWDNVQNPYVAGKLFGEIPDLGPFLAAPETIGRFYAEFYEGETGDTSNLLISYLDNNGPGMWDGIFLDGLVLDRDLTLWGRIYTTNGIFDSVSQHLTIRPAEKIVITSWPEVITGYDIGSNTVLEIGATGGHVRFKWYWGNSGDKSHPMEMGGGPDFFIHITIPSTEREFWVEINNGIEILNTPTAKIIPLPPAFPEIIDQPDDLIRLPDRWGTEQGSYAELIATGGNLQFQWYEGESGDESHPITHSESTINVEMNERKFNFSGQNDISQYWVKVSNSLGETASRTMTSRYGFFEELEILEYPRNTYITDGDLYRNLNHISPVNPFWVRTTIPINQMEIYRKEGASWKKIKRVEPHFSYRDDGKAWSTEFLAVEIPSSGTYRIRVGINSFGYPLYDLDLYRETGDIILHNEVSDDGSNNIASYGTPNFHLLRPPTDLTDNGLYTAWLFLKSPYQPGIRNLYYGEFGDRSHPIEFTSNSRTDIMARDASDLWHTETFFVSWEPKGPGGYWFEVNYDDGSSAQVQLMRPKITPASQGFYSQLEGKADSSLNISIPVGGKIIPIPDFSINQNSPDWYENLESSHWSAVGLPVQLNSFKRAERHLITYIPEEQQYGPEVTISVDGEGPPLLLNQRKAAAVLPDGKVLNLGDLNGDISHTFVCLGPEASEDALHSVFPGGVAGGFHVPEDTEDITVIYVLDDKFSQYSFPLTHLPQEFIDCIELSQTFHNAIISRQLGTFHYVEEYPWMKHHEMGWWYVIPSEGGFFFAAETSPSIFEWNWTSTTVFPYFYNYSRASWNYFLQNSYGWIKDMSTGQWRFVDYR